MFVGTADGKLEQHVKTRHGHPVWSKGVEIFEQVRAALSGVYGRLTRNPDRVRSLSNQCPSIWLYEAGRLALL